MSLGMICRADDGGLGIQTWEIARHLRPERILIVRVGDGRGEFRPERFDACTDVRVVPNPPEPDHMRWLVAGMDRVFTVEGCYQERLISIAHGAGVQLCVLANPELYPAQYRELADRGVIQVFAPTEWERDRLGRHRLLQMPVARDRCVPSGGHETAHTFLHVSAPAMLDRNGTELVREALGFYSGPEITLLVSGPERPTKAERIGRVSVVPLEHVSDYWRLYEGVDVLVLPRRYGGLSLVMQEALSCQVPVLALARDPERFWGGVATTPVLRARLERMKGGDFDVADGSPPHLANAMRDFTEEPDYLDAYRRAARDHACSISWEQLLPDWESALR